MRFDEIDKAIVGAFEARFRNAGNTAPYVKCRIGNNPFDEPKETPFEWVALFVQMPDSVPKAINAKCVRVIGSVILQIFTPANGGDRRGLEIASKFANCFNLSRIGFVGATIDFRTADCGTPLNRNGYRQRNATISFSADVLPLDGETVWVGSDSSDEIAVWVF